MMTTGSLCETLRLRTNTCLTRGVTKLKWLVFYRCIKYQVTQWQYYLAINLHQWHLNYYTLHTVVATLPFDSLASAATLVACTPVSTVILSYCQFSSSWWPEKERERKRQDTGSERQEILSVNLLDMGTLQTTAVNVSAVWEKPWEGRETERKKGKKVKGEGNHLKSRRTHVIQCFRFCLVVCLRLHWMRKKERMRQAWPTIETLSTGSVK